MSNVRRHMVKFVAILAAAAILSYVPCLARAQAIRAEAIEARLFLQHVGSFSPPLTESPELWNVIIGHEENASSSTFVRVEVSGPPGSSGAKNSVALSVTYKGKKVRREVLRKRLGLFSDKGKQYVGFWLPNTGCEQLALVASTSSPGATVSKMVPFACGE